LSDSGAEPGSISTELAEIERSVGTPAYWRNEGGIQERYRELVDARGAHRAAPAATSTAAAREIVSIETIMRTDRRRYDQDETMQQRYFDLLRAREAVAAPGKAVIGTHWSPPSSKALLAEHDRSLAAVAPVAKVAKSGKTETYLELLARNDRERAGPGQEWRLTPDAARATLPPQLVAAWDETGDYAARVTKAQDGIELIARTMGDADLVADMQASFGALPAGARAAVLRELGGPSPGYVAGATAVELKAFREHMPLAVEIEKRWGRETVRRVGIASERLNRVLVGAGLDRAKLQAWWDRAPPVERASIFFVFGSLN
jgi:hypothetical protein